MSQSDPADAPMPVWPEDPAEKRLNAPRPMTVRIAIYGMIAGAVLAVAVSALTLANVDRAALRPEFAKALEKTGEKATAAQIDGSINTMLTTIMVIGVVAALLWAGSAFLIHRRKRWARTAGMVLAAICVLVTFTQLPLLMPNLLIAIPVLILLWTASAREWLGGGRLRA